MGDNVVWWAGLDGLDDGRLGGMTGGLALLSSWTAAIGLLSGTERPLQTRSVLFFCGSRVLWAWQG